MGRFSPGTRPVDCLKPNRLQHDAGMRTEPPPSVASANDSRPSATAAAAPPDEPPVLRVVSNGLRDGPNSGLSQVARKPIGGLLVLPITIAPAASMRWAQMHVASTVWSCSRAIPPSVAGQPGLKSNRSLIAVGTPCSAPTGSPAASAASAARAAARASSKARKVNAVSDGSRASMRAIVASISSGAPTRRSRTASASSVADAQARSCVSDALMLAAAPGRRRSPAAG